MLIHFRKVSAFLIAFLFVGSALAQGVQTEIGLARYEGYDLTETSLKDLPAFDARSNTSFSGENTPDGLSIRYVEISKSAQVKVLSPTRDPKRVWIAFQASTPTTTIKLYRVADTRPYEAAIKRCGEGDLSLLQALTFLHDRTHGRQPSSMNGQRYVIAIGGFTDPESNAKLDYFEFVYLAEYKAWQMQRFYEEYASQKKVLLQGSHIVCRAIAPATNEKPKS